MPKVLQIRAVLFDLDGTLVDSAGDLAAALNRVRRDEGLEPLPPQALRDYVSYGARGLLDAGMNITPEHADYGRLRDAFLDYYESQLYVHTIPFDGIETVLYEITQRGLHWGVVTNKSSRFTEPLMDALNWPTRASCVVCGDSTNNLKPHPAPLLLAAQRIGVLPEECVYVGDAERDIQAANSAGMHSLVAEYGYIPPAEKPREWPASGWIRSPLEVLAWLPQARLPVTAT